MKVIQFNLSESGENHASTKQNVLPHHPDLLYSHTEMQISLILKGEGTLTIGNYSQVFREGNVFIIGANQSHVLKPGPGYPNTGEKSVHMIHLYFDFKRIPETFFLLPELASIRRFIFSCTTGLQVPQEQECQAAALIKTVSTKTNLERLLGLLEIFHFFSTVVSGWKPLTRGFYNYTLPSLDNRMNDVYKYTLDNYANDITLNKIASIAHITPHAFCKYFKQHTRKTYNNFLNEVRVNEACKKIISGSYDGLSTIAYKTGFKGASNFNRVFKKTTGMSPSDYKREFRTKTA